jgi:ubiquinone/menaquinone biosynthesis C-methylase UbiE
MTRRRHPQKDLVLEANIQFHTALATGYDSSQPYFDPINIQRVTRILERLGQQAGNAALLDIGCGTGFIANIAKHVFEKVVGVDVTPAMLSLVEPAPNVMLVLGDTREMSFLDESFSVCVAYGVLHHSEDLRPVIREVFRILKPGGMFYSDEDPNYDYFQFFEKLDPDATDESDLVLREHKNVTEKAIQMKREFGVDESITRLAEYQKMVLGGMQGHSLKELFAEAGFSNVQLGHRWYLGQAQVRANYGLEAERLIRRYLDSCLPMSSHMFKYFKVEATK